MEIEPRIARIARIAAFAAFAANSPIALIPKTEIEPLIALIKTDYEDFLKVSFLPQR